ncbi:MAG TPA: flagellin [Devosiaceae bacterium]|jgi:flagellin-like hook-associated protein FlgL|nr:flagellin [Devosiaceae bacterium]
MADINLTKAVRSNLLSLQSTAAQMAKTQERLATGLKVNSALDNPSNFFTASALNSRASDMGNLLDSMSSGISTIQAADNGLKSITKTVESMQSTLRQARQDKSFKTESYTIALGEGAAVDGNEAISFSGGAVGTTPVSVNLTENTAEAATTASTATGLTGATTLATAGLADGETVIIGDGTDTVTYTVGTAATEDLDDLISAINADADVDVTASINDDGQLVLTADDNETAITVAGTGAIAGVAAQAVPTAVNTAKTVDSLVSEINANTSLEGKIRASNDGGQLRIENLSTTELTVTGVAADGTIDGEAGTDEIGGNTVRKALVEQFNDLRDQLDKFADDASFNGINLLRGDKLTLTFNETGTSTIEIQAKDADGEETSINNASLGITGAVDADFDSDTTLDARLNTLGDALGTLRSHSSSFGSNLSIVENRTDFTKSMINTLETGAANLTLADTNEEAANLLALQTRQQLSSTALSMASQADQAVLRLF